MIFSRVIQYIKSTLNKLFWFVLILLFAILFYAFYQHKTELLVFNFVNPYYEFIHGFPFWVYIVFCFTFLAIICVFIFFILSLYLSVKRNRESALKEKYFSFFAYILTSYFLSDLYKKETHRFNLFQKIKPFLRTRIQLVSFLDAYLTIQETLTLNLSDDFKLLMNHFNLQKKIESFIYNSNFDEKILAMKMLSYLRLNTRNAQIRKIAESKNHALRTEANAAIIRLMEKDELLVRFIGEKHHLSFLDINIIVNAILKNHKMNIDYRALLSKKNIRKNMVGLILAKYRYRENKSNVTLILNHIDAPNPTIKELAWDALLSIVPEGEALDIIIDHFENEPEDIKLLILQRSRNVINKRFFNFLNEIIYHQPLLVKIEILKIILKNGFDAREKYEKAQDEELKMALNEVTCVFNNK